MPLNSLEVPKAQEKASLSTTLETRLGEGGGETAAPPSIPSVTFHVSNATTYNPSFADLISGTNVSNNPNSVSHFLAPTSILASSKISTYTTASSTPFAEPPESVTIAGDDGSAINKQSFLEFLSYTCKNKGSHALRKLQEQLDQYKVAQKELEKELVVSKDESRRLILEKGELQERLNAMHNRLAELLQSKNQSKLTDRKIDELECLLQDDIKHRIELQKALKETQTLAENRLQEFEDLKKSISYRADLKLEHEQLLETQTAQIKEFTILLRDTKFIADEREVELIKVRERKAILEDQTETLSKENANLTITESKLTHENGLLKEKMRELIAANEEINRKFTALQKNYIQQQHQFYEQSVCLNESISLYEKTNKERKMLDVDLQGARKAISDLTIKVANLEKLVARKEKDISDLLQRLNATVKEYEEQLEKKEEQMWIMSEKLSEEKRKQMPMDSEFIVDIEKKWSMRERALVKKVGEMTKAIAGKDRTIKQQEDLITELRKNQFHPRMEKLIKMEKNMKDHIEDFALAEETLQVGFICPTCVTLYKPPIMTFSPCGHTYCESVKDKILFSKRDILLTTCYGKCIRSLREVNFNQNKCQECTVKVEHSFRNHQLERIVDHIASRKDLTTSLLDWIKELNVNTHMDRV